MHTKINMWEVEETKEESRPELFIELYDYGAAEAYYRQLEEEKRKEEEKNTPTEIVFQM
jgi:hypothetical protein